MTIYLVPCGISILTNLRAGRGSPPGLGSLDRAEALETLVRWSRTTDPHVAAPTDALRGFEGCYQGVAGWLRLPEWTPRASAELSTLAARARHDEVAATALSGTDARGLLDAGHCIVLLASETVEGMLSALIVATYLTEGRTDRISTGETPQRADSGQAPRQEPLVLPPGVVVLRVRGLSPDVTDGFEEAAFGVGDIMRTVRDVARGTAVEVHLSGGYKANLLQTLTLAEILNSVAATEGTEVSAWYMFEDSDGLGEALVRLGLRVFDQHTLETMRAELYQVRSGVSVWTSTLKGVAWSGPDHARRLNAFGWGYLALLGAPPPSTDA